MKLDAQALFRDAPAAICVLRGSDHVFELVNEVFQSFYPGRQLVGLPLKQALPELGAQGYFELLDNVARTGKPFAGSEFPAYVDRRGDGQREAAYFNFLYQPIRGEGGTEGIFVHGYEVTRLVEAQARRAALAEAPRARRAAPRLVRHQPRRLSLPAHPARRERPGERLRVPLPERGGLACRQARRGHRLRRQDAAGRLSKARRERPVRRISRGGGDGGAVPGRGALHRRAPRQLLPRHLRTARARHDQPDVRGRDRPALAGGPRAAAQLAHCRALRGAQPGGGGADRGQRRGGGAPGEHGRAGAKARRGLVRGGRRDRAVPRQRRRAARLPTEPAQPRARCPGERTRLLRRVRRRVRAPLPGAQPPQRRGQRVVGGAASPRARTVLRLPRVPLPGRAPLRAERARVPRIAGAAGGPGPRPCRALRRRAGRQGRDPAPEEAAGRDAPGDARRRHRGREEGRLLLQNRAASEIWGREGELERSGERYGQHQAFHADGRPMQKDDWPSMRILRGEQYEPSEVRIVRGDGSTGWMTLNGAPILDEQGQIEAAVVVMSDVTRIKEAEALASQAEAQAKSANRTKDEFLAMLGHELRNPLAPISTALSLMKLRGDEAHARERTVIERQVRHLTRLVDDLLDVSRIARGKMELRPTRMLLGDAVARAIEDASPLLEKRGHHLAVHIDPAPLPLLGDSVRLAQVISNLLTNAAKYTAPGGHIEVRAEREGAQAVVRVKDDGIGIDKEMQPVIFDLFVQEQQAVDRAEGGLGLGLSIVRGLVSAHGGTVEVHSEGRHRGSEFVVRLPALAESAVTPPPGQPAPAAVPALRILVVDDNADAADLVSEAATLMGCKTRVAYDGPGALRLVAEGFRPQVALLDLGLPVMDGHELGARLLRQPELAGLRLVAISGYGQSADRKRSAAEGFSAHLVKPVELEELRRLLVELAAG